MDERLKALKPYVPGEQPQGASYIKLNTNESPFPPSEKVLEAARAQAKDLNLYSDPQAKALCASVAAYYGVRESQVFVGNGSDEVLALIFYGLLRERGVVSSDISYGFYPVFAQLFCIDYKTVEVSEDFSIDARRFAGLKQNIVIANPNAQTGLYLPLSDIESLVCEDKDRIVVVDEAYCDFGGQSAVCMLNEYKNLIVVGTLSKSRQLAGGRVGFAIASEEIAEDLNRIKFCFNPYNLNRMSIAAGKAAFEDIVYFQKTTEAIVENRAYLSQRLESLGFELTQSLANFVLAKKKGISGDEMYKRLKQKGVLVRFLSDEKLKDWVRITVGSKKQIDILLEKINEIFLEDQGIR